MAMYKKEGQLKMEPGEDPRPDQKPNDSPKTPPYPPPPSEGETYPAPDDAGSEGDKK